MKAIKIEEPKVCPFCGAPVVRILDDGAHLYCSNPDCSERKLAKLNYFVTKECMNIDGLSQKTLKKLIDNLHISDWSDLYTLTYDDFIAGGCGKKTALKLVDEIAKSRTEVPAERVLMSLGIPMVGKVTAKELLEKYGSFAEIERVAKSNDFAEIPDYIGNEVGKNILKYFRLNENKDLQNVYKYLQTTYVKSSPTVSNNKLAGLTLMATGTLTNFSRDGIKDSVVENGGTYASGISKKLDYLIVGDKAGSSKLKKAEELGIKQLTETEYLNLIK